MTVTMALQGCSGSFSDCKTSIFYLFHHSDSKPDKPWVKRQPRRDISDKSHCYCRAKNPPRHHNTPAEREAGQHEQHRSIGTATLGKASHAAKPRETQTVSQLLPPHALSCTQQWLAAAGSTHGTAGALRKAFCTLFLSPDHQDSNKDLI